MLLLFFISTPEVAFCQDPGPPGEPIPLCEAGTEPGSLPSTAIPICDTGVYYHNYPFYCRGGTVMVPYACTPDQDPFPPPQDWPYTIFSPVYYRFKCYASGTFGFLIKPIGANKNLDWSLYDITNKFPETVISNTQNIIAGNWSPELGQTGTIDRGTPFFVCKKYGGYYQYSEMPNFIVGHEYLLLIANPTQNTEDFTLTISGGTADITDPIKPHIVSAKAECDGKEITIKLNKKIDCKSLTSTGSEFSISSTTTSIVSATAYECSSPFVYEKLFYELKITLSAPLVNGSYTITTKNGSDGNTLLDVCGNAVPVNETVAFDFLVPKPILADSVGKPDCTPDSVRLYFPKKISCASISTNGSDFSITGPQAVTVKAASGNCINGKTDYVIVKFNQPITTKGNYQLTLKVGDDGSVIVDECGEESPPQTINFSVADTVNADINYITKFGCQKDTLIFSHNGANDINKWNWVFNNNIFVATQTHSIIFPAASNNTVKLTVDNGTCKDSDSISIILDNEVKADFSMVNITCPEDALAVINNTTGVADIWRWNYDVAGRSNVKDPPPFLFPTINKEAYYTVKLVATSSTLNCSDSIRKKLTVLDHCLIAVPTAFTPNNDGRNDFFRPHNALKADKYEFKVYNRWGQIVFQTNNWQDKWDGKINGNLQVSGVFVWMLSYINRDTKMEVFEKGTVTVIR